MKARRFEHADKDRFWEIYWEELEAEVTSGARKTKGRSRRREFGSPFELKAFVEGEIAKRLREGFAEVVPELIAVTSAPVSSAPAEWIARIAAEFDDDAPRLVYADWLQSQGDPLGELIVVQCERARLDPYDPKQKALAEREAYLLSTYRLRWVPQLGEVELAFHRGLIERVRMELPYDHAKLERVLAVAPLVRTLELVAREGGMLARGRLPWELPVPAPALRGLTGLFVRGRRLLPGAVRTLLDHRELLGLDRLGLRSAGLGPEDVCVIGRRSWRALDLHDNVLGVRGITHLLEQTQLVTLHVGSSGVGDEGARLLAGAPFRALRDLSLRRSNLGAKSVAALMRSPNLEALRVLDLSCNVLDEAAVTALCESTLPALVELDLSETELGDRGAIALAGSSMSRRLVSLELGNNGIGEPGIRALAEAYLPALRYLNVSGNPLGDSSALIRRALPHVRVVAKTRSAPVQAVAVPRPIMTFEIGATIEIKYGVFAHFSGIVESVAPERRKLRVRVITLGSPTSVEIDVSEVDR